MFGGLQGLGANSPGGCAGLSSFVGVPCTAALGELLGFRFQVRWCRIEAVRWQGSGNQGFVVFWVLGSGFAYVYVHVTFL